MSLGEAGAAGKWRQVIDLGVRLLSPDLRAEAERSGRNPISVHQELIVGTAARLLDAEVDWWLANELEGSLTGGLRLENAPAARPASALMRQAYDTRQVCCQFEGQPDAILPWQEDPAAPEDRDFGSNGTSPGGPGRMGVSAVAAPVIIEDTETNTYPVIGVLQLNRPDGAPFQPGEVELLEGIAAQAAIALQAERQMEIERWRIEQLSLVRQVSAQIADVRNLDELFDRVTQLILATFNYYFVAIFTLEPGEDVLHFRDRAGPARKNPEAVDDLNQALAIHLGEGIVGYVAQSGEEILANDVSQEPRYRYTDSLPETKSEVALPLKIEDRILGVLDVQSNRPMAFRETDMLVLRALSGNIAIAVEDARLYSALRRRAEQLSTVSEVSNAITSILDQDELLNELVTLIQKMFGYPYVHLFTVHKGRRKIFYEAGSGSRSSLLREQQFAYDLDDTTGIIPWVARQGETVLANDVEKEPRYRPSALPPANTRSELSVPLIFGGEVLGVLDVQSDRLNAFGEEDRFLFEALADNVAVAMRNASLYQSELWRRQVADSLREVAGLLSADAALDQVLESILIELERTLPSDAAAIWLWEENQQKENLPVLHLAAVRGAGPDSAGAESQLRLEDLLSRYTESPVNGEEPQTSSWFAEALQADRPLIREPHSLYDPVGTVLGFPPDYSAIAVPLRVGQQSLGLLTLAHRSSGRYGAEARQMTAAFASYAAVAIENTRLYEAAHEQAWVSTVLLQVAEATQSLNNLHELLATVVRITPMLVGVKACALYMLDENGAFIPAAAYGLEPDQQTEFERWRFAPGDIPAFSRLMESRQSLILRGEDTDPLLSSILFPGMLANKTPETQSGLAASLLEDQEVLVLVPMLAHGEVLGAFLIDYSGDQTGNGGGGTAALFDERLAILQGIAHQTATAVENIRLLKSQKEEAYVSVALLQVAQAVVSSNDLDETLSAIVRITPILVGVKRTAVYLWDAEEEVFRLSQSYGFPRDAEVQVYSPGEFPLLEAVRQWDTLFAYPAESGYAVDDPVDAPASWAQIVPPDLDEVEEYLEDGERLLLAFPLSVKGQVLGVMLVEEPDPFSVEGLHSGSLSRLREKRLEITTGISQQAALAIQNDHLQRETVERERLEREFQLAREIQRKFLPDHIPDIPGWDLDVRWRTAREVGGDFYDYFELADNRMGIVVADVADKGMPAALFMTLIRTLVRAAVRENHSPAWVLERVNEILVPDAQDGMFVTIVYALLDLESGELVYANAGHCPPICFRHESRELHTLVRSGMALGVMEANRLEERSVSLEPGDSLLFYTDGITEAFSTEGEMYGEARLHQVVQTISQDAAPGEVLDSIENSLSDFAGDIPRADDLTLLALRRTYGGDASPLIA